MLFEDQPKVNTIATTKKNTIKKSNNNNNNCESLSTGDVDEFEM